MAGGRVGGRAELEPERGREQGAREGEVMLLQNFFFSSIHFGSYWEVSKIDRSIAIDGLATTVLLLPACIA